MSGKYLLELDGISAGWIMSAEGGHATAGVKYEDITITCGTGMSKAFYGWMKDSFDHKHSRKNGALISASFDHKEMSRLSFTGARIKEIGFPTLDAASKDAAKLTVTLEAAHTRDVPAQAGSLPPDAAAHKPWVSSSFRLTIDGLDCSRVNKIEALVMKQKVVEHPAGEGASLEIPKLVVTLPEPHAEELHLWQESKHKAGSLVYLTADGKEALFELTFRGLGIFKVAPEKLEARSEAIRRLKFEMYCEDIHFDYKAAWA